MNRIFRNWLPLAGILLFAGISSAAAPAELLKWVPDGGTFYGEFRPSALMKSALYREICQKYPRMEHYMNLGREHVGGYQGDLEWAVFSSWDRLEGLAFFLYFSEPVDMEQFSRVLKEKNLADKYEKTEISGHTAYVLKQKMLGTRSCLITLSDQAMLSCLENCAGDLLKAKPVSGTAAASLASEPGEGCFFRLFPDREDADSSVQSYSARGYLSKDSSLNAEVCLVCSDASKAMDLEKQIRQWMMMGVGLLFADDGMLGMEVVSRIRVVRQSRILNITASLPENLVLRLAGYGISQAEKREKELEERLRFKEERRRQQLQRNGRELPDKPAGESSGEDAAMLSRMDAE